MFYHNLKNIQKNKNPLPCLKETWSQPRRARPACLGLPCSIRHRHMVAFSHHLYARVSPGYWVYPLEMQNRNRIRKRLTRLRSIGVVKEQLPCGRTLHPLSALGDESQPLSIGERRGTQVTHTSCVPDSRLNYISWLIFTKGKWVLYPYYIEDIEMGKGCVCHYLPKVTQVLRDKAEFECQPIWSLCAEPLQHTP